MDTRNHEIYPSRESATNAGVPDEHIEQVDVMTITSGPFKGRRYLKNADGSLGRRVFPSKEKVTGA